MQTVMLEKTKSCTIPHHLLLIGEINDEEIKETRGPSNIETREKVLPLKRTFQSTLL